MILDDDFLQEIGVADCPLEVQQRFREGYVNVLQLCVGTILSDGLSEAQLREFETLMEDDAAAITAWIDDHALDYENDEDYHKVRRKQEREARQEGKEVSQLALFSEYVQGKWLKKNRPDYEKVVTRTTENLKKLAAQDPEKFLTKEGLTSIFQSVDGISGDTPDELEGGHPDPDVALAA